jgi:hypothetical protein
MSSKIDGTEYPDKTTCCNAGTRIIINGGALSVTCTACGKGVPPMKTVQGFEVVGGLGGAELKNCSTLDG